MVIIYGSNTLEQLQALPKSRKQLVVVIPHADEDLLLDDIVAQVPRFAEIIVARTLPDAFELV